MPAEILLPTAYLPPAGYFSLIARSEKVLIEKEENYIKQTYRNRCTILAANGPVSLSVPVRKSNSLKTAIKEAAIDYSRRWQQVHLGAISSAYGRSPYFQFYYKDFEKIILKKHKFLLDLNDELLTECVNKLNLKTCISYTTRFIKPGDAENDYRYIPLPEFKSYPYIQVFPSGGFTGGFSIIDLIFNTGPEAKDYFRSE